MKCDICGKEGASEYRTPDGIHDVVYRRCAICFDKGNNKDCFAVVRVDADYDYIEGVECICTFNTEDEAENYIAEAKNRQELSWQYFISYRDEWIDALDVPMLEYSDWMAYLKKFGITYFTDSQNFKQFLRYYLKNYQKLDNMDYNPPEITYDGNNLFVVKIEG